MVGGRVGRVVAGGRVVGIVLVRGKVGVVFWVVSTVGEMVLL